VNGGYPLFNGILLPPVYLRVSSGVSGVVWLPENNCTVPFTKQGWTVLYSQPKFEPGFSKDIGFKAGWISILALFSF
jgi:hypothetical protein